MAAKVFRKKEAENFPDFSPHAETWRRSGHKKQPQISQMNTDLI